MRSTRLAKATLRLSPEAQAFARDRSLRAMQELELLMRWGRSETMRTAAALALLHAAEHPEGNHGRSLIEFFSAIPVDEPDRGDEPADAGGGERGPDAGQPG